MLTGSCSADKDLEISPGSAAPSSNTRNAIAPWETGPSGNAGFGNHRRELGVLETSGGPSPRIPAINRQPPTALSPHQNPPWANGNPPPQLSSVFGSFYDDSSEDIGQLSPGFRPGSSQEDMGAFPGEDRRPSIASATTVSSIGSKSSVGRGFNKKLHGFFGEDYPGNENSRQCSNFSLPPSALFPAGGHSTDPTGTRQTRHRTNSATNNAVGLHASRPESPASFSRPRTPRSSEVTPWEFQDSSIKVRNFHSRSVEQTKSCVYENLTLAVLVSNTILVRRLLTFLSRNCLLLPTKMQDRPRESRDSTITTDCTFPGIDIHEARMNRKPASCLTIHHHVLS